MGVAWSPPTPPAQIPYGTRTNRSASHFAFALRASTLAPRATVDKTVGKKAGQCVCGRLSPIAIVAMDDAFFHDEEHLLGLTDVLTGIARHRDDVCELSHFE